MLNHHRLFTGISCLVILLLSGCGNQPEHAASAQAGVIRTAAATAAIRHEPENYEATGAISAQTASVLSSKIMGVIRQVNVREGDHVKKGQVLVNIDPRQVNAQYQQAQAALSEARKAETAAVSSHNAAVASAELARATYERYVNLMKNESASRQEFDEVTSRYRQAQAAAAQSQAMVEASRSRIRQAEAAVSGAAVSENDARITAPYDGVIVAKMVEPGSLAAPGAPLLKIDNVQSLRADAMIPENILQSVSSGQVLTVTIPAANMVVTGHVQTIAPAADPSSRTFTVKIEIPRQPAIHPGMFCRISLPLGIQDKYLIPRSAILHQGQLTGIFMLDADQHARFRLLRTGASFGDMIEVLSGIAAGDRYVVKPPPTMMDGVKVEVSS